MTHASDERIVISVRSSVKAKPWLANELIDRAHTRLQLIQEILYLFPSSQQTCMSSSRHVTFITTTCTVLHNSRSCDISHAHHLYSVICCYETGTLMV